MTYITWKDEVESYLGNLSASEKQKVFSYFAEMYADKRDAGISEEKIVEGFGAPYDVAKRILADSKDDSSESGARKDSPSGGNNYNYNYYNYNYGGAPQGGKSAFGAGYTPPNDRYAAPEEHFTPPDKGDVDVSDLDMPLPEGTPKPKEKKNGESPFSAFLKLLLLAIPVFVLFCLWMGLTVGCVGGAISGIVSGCMDIGEAAGTLVAHGGKEPIGLLGSGILTFGVGLLFIPLTHLFIKLAWKTIRWVYRKLKAILCL